MRVLIVEDDDMLASLIAEQVVDLGYEVCAIARDEYDAVTAGIKHRPNLVLMDLRLANGTSGAAARTLYELYQIRCLFMSASLDAATQNELKALKPLGFLNKPVRLHTLKHALTAAGAL